MVLRVMSCVGSSVIAIKEGEQIMHMTWTSPHTEVLRTAAAKH